MVFDVPHFSAWGLFTSHPNPRVVTTDRPSETLGSATPSPHRFDMQIERGAQRISISATAVGTEVAHDRTPRVPMFCGGVSARTWMDPPPELGDRRESLFGAVGAVRVWELLPDEPTGPFAAALACALDGGGSVGSHVQSRDAEIVVCIEGNGTVVVAGVARAFTPGAVAYVPLGATLSLRNEDRERLRYLIIKAAP